MVTSDNHSWFVFRRYNEFYKLYEMLKKQVSVTCLVNTDSCKLGSTAVLLAALYKTVTWNKEHKVQMFENEVLLDSLMCLQLQYLSAWCIINNTMCVSIIIQQDATIYSLFISVYCGILLDNYWYTLRDAQTIEYKKKTWCTKQRTWHKLILYGEMLNKVKVHPVNSHSVTEGEQQYSATLTLTLPLDRGGWLPSCLSHCTTVK